MAEAGGNLWTPPILDLAVDRYAAWTAWKEKWTDYAVVTKLNEKDAEYKCAMLRYTFTEETRKIYNSLNFTDEQKKDSKHILETMETFAKGIINETMERHMFNSRRQGEGELFDDFLTDVKTLSKNCGFCDTCYDGLIRDRIVGGINDHSLRQKLLSEKELGLKKAEEMCRAKEKAKQGVETIKESQNSEQAKEVDAISRQQKHTTPRSRNNHERRPNYNKNQYTTKTEVTHKNPCRFCSQYHNRGKQYCPAWEKKCMSCGLRNHSKGSEVCRNKYGDKGDRNKINALNYDSEEDDVGALFLGSVNDETDRKGVNWEIHMPAKNGTIQFKIDTGADVTVISESDLEKLGLSKKDVKPTRKKLMGPANQKLKCIGYIRTQFKWGDNESEELVYICKELKRALLGKPAINKLGILKLEKPETYSCGEVKQEKEEHPVVKKYPSVFKGLGKIKGDPIHVKMKDDIVPHQVTTPRHVAIPLRKRVDEEIKRMEQIGVIRKVDEPTAWCHPIVIVPKPSGEIRICIDLTKLNTGIERELYQLESVDETIAKLGDECVFMSKVDANSGYWQMPLDEDSQLLTTFITPLGRFCCTTGPFGMSSMQEIFNKKMDVVIEGLEGIAKSTDDFLIYAKTEAGHDERLDKLVERFAEHGVTLNISKCQFNKKEIEFLGYKLSQAGIIPLESKTEAITNFKTPENITELRRFLGMAQQMTRFTTELAKESAPLRDLLSTKNEWIWTEVHERAINAIKHILASPKTLKLYDVNKPTKLRVDGSQLNGVAVILYQQHGKEWYPVACASRYLSKVEKNYYPIENEMLAVTWGCKKMNLYLQGLTHFIIQTDHKPLIPILNNKPITDMSVKIQRMRMKLLQYSFTAEHVKGKELEDADALSRSPNEQPTKEDTLAEQEIENYINTVITNMPASSRYMEEVKKLTAEDKTLQKLNEIIRNKWPSTKKECSKEIRPYWDSRHDITEIEQMLVKGNRIIIPQKMRNDVLVKLHVGHQGMEKCKRRARQSCYWPGMNQEIEKMVNTCEHCLKYKPNKSQEPLLPPPLPTRAWEKIGSDMFEIKGQMYILFTDYYSLWPEVYTLTSPTTENVIKAAKDIFARHGIPSELITDNGSQYKSYEFKKFSIEWDFRHITSSPRYPQSNGLAESSVKNVKMMIKKCTESKQDIKQGLLAIRNTPLQCGSSPAELLFGRKLQDNVPALIDKNKNTSRRDIYAERSAQKERFDKHVKQTSNSNSSTFNIGQKVAIQEHHSKEWTLRGTIMKEVAPRSYSIRMKNGSIFRRNVRHIRKLHSTTSNMPITYNNVPADNSDESDTDTIPYEDGDELREEDTNETLEEETPNIDPEKEQYITRSGRTVSVKTPTDYDDI